MRREFIAFKMAAALAVSFVTASSSEAALLQDTFNLTLPNPNTFNTNFQLATRQSGTLATVSWEKSGDANGGQVGNTTLGGTGDYHLLANNTTNALLTNFGGSLSAGGLDISFDLAPGSISSSPGSWSAISIGLSSANRHAYINGATPHFGILFQKDGGYQAFDGNTFVGSGSSGISGSSFSAVRL